MLSGVSHGAKLRRKAVYGVRAAAPWWPAAVALVALPGCGASGIVTPVYDEATRELVRLDYDYDRDGRVDVRTFMEKGRAVRLVGDTDSDGRPDRWEYYDASGGFVRLGGSSAGDGIEDSWLYASGDQRRVELATSRDGFVDRREFYRGDLLVRVEVDTNRDGRQSAVGAGPTARR